MNMRMQYPDVEILPDVFSVLPDLQVFGIVVTGYNDAIRRIDIEDVHATKFDMEPALGVTLLSQLPAISSWRDVYRRMGLKPLTHHTRVESLLQRARKGWRRWQTGRKHVDFYNGFSIRCYAPVAAYDLEKIEHTTMHLRMLNPDKDRFNPVGGPSEAFPLKPGVAVYAVDNNIACWGLNHRDSRDYAVTKTTRKAIFLSEANAVAQVDASRAAIDALRLSLSALGAHCTPCIQYNRQYPRGECLAS
jgi:DNA/RNA-binding domain of Phe-tRNA-synthetase-like protein